MKRRIITSSILAILVCLCIIAGATFALFTDKTEFNIAVTSGDVEIYASASINALYSAKGADAADDEYLVDENGNTYTHEKQETYFLNGGKATLNGANLVIERLTPGDRVDVDINVDNTSDVAIQYRYKLEANDTNLAIGMVVTVDGVSYEALSSWTSEWRAATATDGVAEAIPVETISVELPVYAGNEYQSENADGKVESVEYIITVEAVQGNAVTDNEAKVVLYETAPVGVTPDGEAVEGTTYEGEALNSSRTDLLVVQNVELVGNATITAKRGYDTVVLENVVADVNGNLITSETNNTIVLHNCDITLDEGEMLIVIPDGVTVDQVMIHDVTVNGVLLTQDAAEDLIQGVVAYCEVW